MPFPAIVIHVQIEFDSMGADPDPWWKPFFWVRRYREERYCQDVLRFGALGFHIGLSAARHPDPDGVRTPKKGDS